MKAKFLIVFISLTCLCIPSLTLAQSSYEDARNYLDNKNYEKALPIYKELYKSSPHNKEILQEYVLALINTKDFATAEQVVKKRLDSEANNPFVVQDLGIIYTYAKKEKKAEEQFQKVYSYINGDDILTQQIANNFSNNNLFDWAIKTYERASLLLQMPNLYNAALSKLYKQKGDIDKAINLLVESAATSFQFNEKENVESKMLELIGNNVEDQKKAQKAILKALNNQPDNYLYGQLFSWILSIQNNWEQSFTQIKAIEKRSTDKDKGKLFLTFAQSALLEKKYEFVQKSYAEITNLDFSNPYYRKSQELYIQSLLINIEERAINADKQKEQLSSLFLKYFEQYPDAYYNPILNDYAYFEAQLNNNINKSIELLQTAINKSPFASKLYIGMCKLQLGDYLTIKGDVWEAALLYAQVDKAFREDALGEDARFRNAKLSYYQNDFEQAQGQLSVLKASTSELIANDALYLSILITENTPTDSNWQPLKYFASADLLIFQNKDNEAITLLDSILYLYPKTPLADDILLAKSKIALKQKNYIQAINHLKQIIEKYSTDVLGDDATFQIAEINRKFLSNTKEANYYYEFLITNYPGSSFVNLSRKYLDAPQILNP